MTSRILSMASGISPLEKIVQLGSAAVIIFEHSFYILDQRRHLQDQQNSVPSYIEALEQYMVSSHATAVRDAVNTIVHTNRGNSSNWKTKLLPGRFRRKDYSGLIEAILTITLEHRLPRP